MAIEVGQPAPEFTLQTQDKADWSLADQRGKNVVLLWYPLDWSPTCTTENCRISGDSPIDAGDAVIVGISRDSVWSHKAYKVAQGITHDLLADPDLAVTDQFGLRHPKVSFISHRATVIVDKAGNVAFVGVQQATGDERDWSAVQTALDAL